MGVAAAAWLAAAGARWWGIVTLAGIVGLVAVLAVRPQSRTMSLLVGVVVITTWASGYGAVARETAVLEHVSSPGVVDHTVRLLDDPQQGDHGWWALSIPDPPQPGRPPSIPLLLSLAEEPEAVARDVVQVRGVMSARTGHAGGSPYSGVVTVGSIEVVAAPQPPWWRAGNAVRARTLAAVTGRDRAHALLGGFLVGDTSEVPEADMEAMRRSGLSHLVAVSGSNVALFLTLSMLAAGPLASGPRRRAVAGLAALVVLVVATRWEPSVVRASVMAGLVLAGRVGGWVVDGATALAVTVVIVLAVSGELATDVGFTLSVLATGGVMAGVPLVGRHMPGHLGTVLGATVGAQVTVAPVLVAAFGAVPLLSPLTNLVAIPVVAASTAVGAVGVGVGSELVVAVAAVGAELVLAVAAMTAGWPQVGWIGTAVVVMAASATAVRRLRPLVAVVGATVVALVLLGGFGRPPLPAAVVLDVGQGDAILVLSGDGPTMLVDAGPDPALLEGKLAEYGVDRIDLVVLTHVHADHASGLEAVLGRRPVGELWFPGPPHETGASRQARELARTHGVTVGAAPVGGVFAFGDLTVEVLAPVRRYASPNDQSVVLRVRAGQGPRLLLTGDIETHAQDDLAGVEAEILKVPHQGGATSDLEWLSDVDASWAIISVGPNDFGHPAPDVIDVFEESGARISRTDLDGDVVVPLSR